jgi:hypothetical protein
MSENQISPIFLGSLRVSASRMDPTRLAITPQVALTRTALLRAGKGNGAAVRALKAGANAHANDLAPIVARLNAEGRTSLPRLALALNEGGFATARGGRWFPSSVRNLLARIEGAA